MIADYVVKIDLAQNATDHTYSISRRERDIPLTPLDITEKWQNSRWETEIRKNRSSAKHLEFWMWEKFLPKKSIALGTKAKPRDSLQPHRVAFVTFTMRLTTCTLPNIIIIIASAIFSHSRLCSCLPISQIPLQHKQTPKVDLKFTYKSNSQSSTDCELVTPQAHDSTMSEFETVFFVFIASKSNLVCLELSISSKLGHGNPGHAKAQN